MTSPNYAAWVRIADRITQDRTQTLTVSVIPAAMFSSTIELLETRIADLAGSGERLIDQFEGANLDSVGIGDIFGGLVGAIGAAAELAQAVGVYSDFADWADSVGSPVVVPARKADAVSQGASFRDDDGTPSTMRHRVWKTRAGLVVEFEAADGAGGWTSTGDTTLLPATAKIGRPLQRVVADATKQWRQLAAAQRELEGGLGQ